MALRFQVWLTERMVVPPTEIESSTEDIRLEYWMTNPGFEIFSLEC